MSSGSYNLRVRGLAVAAALALGCTRPATALVIVVDTDFATPGELATVEATVQSDSTTTVRSFRFGAGDGGVAVRAPFSFTVAPRGGDASRSAELTLRGFRAGGAPLVVRRARLRFAEGYTLVLPMFLASRCRIDTMQCNPNEPCAVSGCEPLEVDVSTLTPVTPGQEVQRDATADAHEAALDAGVDLDDVAKPPDVMDVFDAFDAFDGFDVSAVKDAPDVVEVFDAGEPMDAVHEADAGEDTPEVADVQAPVEAGDVADAPAEACPVGGCGDPFDIVQVAAGASSTCALRREGTARCWGNNRNGQLGNGRAGTTELVLVTVVTSNDDTRPLAGVAQLACGEAFCCAALRDSTARCWGDNAFGQLGNASVTPSPAPVVVGDPVEAGMPFRGVVEVAAGANFACARRTDGTVWCWGNNANGHLGTGAMDTSPLRSRPARVVAGGGSSDPLADTVQLAAQAEHTCAVMRLGALRCWGRNHFGQLGHDASAYLYAADPLAVGRVGEVVEARPGATHTCARLRDGSVRCWGNNRLGALGDGTTANRSTPADVLVSAGGVGLRPVVGVACGADHACALVGDGTARCWGAGDVGQLGGGAFTPAASSPVTVVDVTDAVELVTAARHVCARGRDGAVRCWGNNDFGQLGDRTQVARAAPVRVVGL